MNFDSIIGGMSFSELQQRCPGISYVPSCRFEHKGKSYYYMASQDLILEVSEEKVDVLKSSFEDAVESFKHALEAKDVKKMNKAQIDVDALSNIILELTEEWIDPRAAVGGWN